MNKRSSRKTANPSPRTEGDETTGATRRTSRISIPSVVRKSIWPLVFTITVAALIWRYEFRPLQEATSQLQGTWRLAVGAPPNERREDSFIYFDENESWDAYQNQDSWRADRSRISLERAENFFLVRRSFGFDYGTTRETEYVLFLKGDRLYVLHGLADLDPVQQGEIRKFWRTDALPDAASDAIRESLERARARGR
jgi:hypothetical protein